MGCAIVAMGMLLISDFLLEANCKAIRESNLPSSIKSAMLLGLVRPGISEEKLERLIGRSSGGIGIGVLCYILFYDDLHLCAFVDRDGRCWLKYSPKQKLEGP